MLPLECCSVCVTGETQTDTDRRKTDRKTEVNGDKQREGKQTDRETETEREGKQTDKETETEREGKHTDKETEMCSPSDPSAVMQSHPSCSSECIADAILNGHI
jgi:hypothetical protein